MFKSHVTYGFIACVLAALGNAVAIKGAQGGVNFITGERPSRQEFSTFRSSGPAFDLYILALQRFQQQNQSSPLSYFQVAGVHGLPYYSWDGVSGQNLAGYCTHASILFPTWHRPYLALFEQILWNNAQQIATAYPTALREEYQQAANTLRLPYWDWSINPTMPAEVSQPMITVNGPFGSRNIVNPLYNYTFNPLPSSSDFPPSALSSFRSTVRYPDSAGQSQPDLVNKQLQANGASLHSQTYQLLSQQSNYAPFSNTGFTDSRGIHYNSLENMHNMIHVLIGNGGHMSSVPYSAFDPIFWLHHANVDRLFAIWQTIYPDSYVTSEVNVYGTFTNPPGVAEIAKTALTPFHSNDAGDLYTSTAVRSTRSFGYTYPEIQDWGVNASQITANVKAQLNTLYNPSSSMSQHALTDRAGSVTRRNPNGMRNQWFINIRVDKSAISLSFFVHFFLGSPPADPAVWSFAPNLIGSYSVLDIIAVTPANDGNNRPTTLYGQVPLTHALLAEGAPSLAPRTVVPFLTSQLNWRLQGIDDAPLDIAQYPSLQLYVAGQRVIPRGTEDSFPKYGNMTAYRSVTRGKLGGLRDEDPI